MRAVLLAAGSARRMQGRDKLLEPVQGQPLLRVLALRLLDSGVAQVAVTLRADDPARRAAYITRLVQGLDEELLSRALIDDEDLATEPGAEGRG